MGEPAITIVNSGRDFGGMSSDELDRILDTITPDGQVATGGDEPPVPPSEPEIPAVPESPAPVEPEPPVEPEIDLAASEKEGDRIARELLEAKIAALEAHNSRLAGKLGFVEQKLKVAPVASEPYEPQTQEEVDRLTSLEQRLEQSEARRTRAEVSQAVEQEFAALDGAWSTDYAAEIRAIAPKYQDQIQAAMDTNDPALARQITKAVGLMVKAEVTQARWEASHKDLVARKASTAPAAMAAKKAASVSGSGAVPTPAPKPRSYADMTPSEADAWLRENVR